MPAEKLSMKKIREALRLYYEGLGYRIISSSTGIGLGSVSHYIKRAKAYGLSWPLPEGLNDELLQARLFPKELVNDKPHLDFKKTDAELKRKGVTLLLLWYEYREAHLKGYSYSQFCRLYRSHAKQLSPSMRIRHHMV
jgi:transposase